MKFFKIKYGMETKKENEIMLYQPNETIRLEVKIQEDTVWLTQQQIALLFGVKQPAISKHFKNIFESGELDELSVYSILEYTANDGKLFAFSKMCISQDFILNHLK